MQLFTQKGSSKEDVDNFWREKEEQLKAPIEFKTFASFIGVAVLGKPVETNDKKAGTAFTDRGGILYGAGDSLFFEDFEKKNFLSFLFGGDKSEWSKTEFSFPVSDIAEVRPVSEEGARASVKGKISPVHAKKPGKISQILNAGNFRFFSVELKSGEYFFFEILEKKGFLKFVEERKV